MSHRRYLRVLLVASIVLLALYVQRHASAPSPSYVDQVAVLSSFEQSALISTASIPATIDPVTATGDYVASPAGGMP